MMHDLARYAKAIVAGVVAGAAAATPLVDDGLLPSEWLIILIATLTGTGLVAAIPNAGFVDEQRVAALADDAGTFVAGPASVIKDGAPVAVTRDDDPPPEVETLYRAP